MELKPGMKVEYAGRPAIVQRVMKNGVRIAFDGRGLQAGDYVHKTVSKSDIKAAL